MRSLLYVFSFVALIGLAYWAYSENYRTQAALNEVSTLHHDIGVARARLGVLKAEWAYLNRPERLRDLANLNFDRLGLMPLAPDQLGEIDQIAYPPEPLLPITEPIEVMGRNIETGDIETGEATQ